MEKTKRKTMAARFAKRIGLYAVGMLLFASFISAHSVTKIPKLPWEEPLLYIKIASAIILVISLIIILKQKFNEKAKKTLFTIITISVMLPTLYLGAHTVYENFISVTKGPVHWHADQQVIVCGERLDLVDPKFPRNKVGTPLFHEHNDDRMHVEGTVELLEHVNLHNWFRVLGGILEPGYLAYPLEDELVEVRDGDSCPNGNPATLKVYVNGNKVEDYANHLIYPDPFVPPGDCIIYLFDETNEDTTQILCESWEAKEWTYENFKRPTKTIGDHTWQ